MELIKYCDVCNKTHLCFMYENKMQGGSRGHTVDRELKNVCNVKVKHEFSEAAGHLRGLVVLITDFLFHIAQPCFFYFILSMIIFLFHVFIYR